jgi:hypothetical protein
VRKITTLYLIILGNNKVQFEQLAVRCLVQGAAKTSLPQRLLKWSLILFKTLLQNIYILAYFIVTTLMESSRKARQGGGRYVLTLYGFQH